MLPEACDLVRVYEPENHRLLATGHGVSGGAYPLHFECDNGAGALLIYYFGKGKRAVVVQNGPNEGVTARLATRWAKDHREWTLDW